MKNTNLQVLVLGATGMLGRIVYSYLAKKNGKNMHGTSRDRKNKDLIYFNFKKSMDIENFFRDNSFSFIINCIGALKGSPKSKLELLNTIFPNTLLKLSEKYNFKVINISTDAVFSSFAGQVYETSTPNPDDLYGKSKLNGEMSKNTINIRTSILGFDPNEHKGLLEFLLKNKNKKIIGFTNQKWAGSTTLQLSHFIKWLISKNNFINLQEKTKIIHFTPLGSVTKYEILKTLSRLINNVKIIKRDGPKQTRILETIYVDEIKLRKYTKNLEHAIEELIEFDKNYVKTYKN